MKTKNTTFLFSLIMFLYSSFSFADESMLISALAKAYYSCVQGQNDTSLNMKVINEFGKVYQMLISTRLSFEGCEELEKKLEEFKKDIVGLTEIFSCDLKDDGRSRLHIIVATPAPSIHYADTPKIFPTEKECLVEAEKRNHVEN